MKLYCILSADEKSKSFVKSLFVDAKRVSGGAEFEAVDALEAGEAGQVAGLDVRHHVTPLDRLKAAAGRETEEPVAGRVPRDQRVLRGLPVWNIPTLSRTFQLAAKEKFSYFNG